MIVARKKSKYELLKRFWIASLGCVWLVLSAYTVREKYFSVLTSDLFTVTGVCIYSASLLCWLLSYNIAIITELELLNETFAETEIPPIGVSPAVIGVLLAISFGSAIALSYDFEASILFVILVQSFDIIGFAFIKRAVLRACLNASRARQRRSRHIDAVFYYFIMNLHDVRHAVLLLIFCLSLSLHLHAQVFPNPFLLYAPYYIVSASILVGLVVIWRWRSQRSVSIVALSE